jgi:hypothetical protein
VAGATRLGLHFGVLHLQHAQILNPSTLNPSTFNSQSGSNLSGSCPQPSCLVGHTVGTCHRGDLFPWERNKLVVVLFSGDSLCNPVILEKTLKQQQAVSRVCTQSW